MRRRRLIWWGIVLLFVLGLAAWFEPGQRLRGVVFGEAFYAGKPTSYWVAQLSGDSPDRQMEAIWSLRDGKASACAVLCQMVRNPAHPIELRSQAAGLLGELGEGGKPGIPVLLEALEQPNPYLQQIAARALGEVASGEDAVLLHLIPLLRRGNIGNVLAILTRAPAGGPEVVAELTRIVHDNEEAGWTALALEALALRRGQARSALAAILEVVEDADPVVRARAVLALGRIGSAEEPVLRACRTHLRDNNAEVRAAAARSLGWFGPQAHAAIPELRNLLDDRDPVVRDRAKQALQRIETPKKEPQNQGNKSKNQDR